jgi:hypothetical protein
MKTLPHNRIIRELWVKNLHRNSATEHEVVRFPHLCHSADGQLGLQLVSLCENASRECAASLLCGWWPSVVRVHAVSEQR